MTTNTRTAFAGQLATGARRAARRVLPAGVRARLGARLAASPLAGHLALNARKAGATLDARYFELFYESAPDPFKLEGNPYEERKYRHQMEVLGDRRFHRALEVGCSIGLFTAMLAPSCDELLAVDISEVAVGRTRERTAGMPQVRAERRTLPTEMPDGPFDLIVCSDVLYYWSMEMVDAAVDRFVSMLSPGGTLLALHFRRDSGALLRGDDVHDRLLDRLPLKHVLGSTNDDYRMDRWDK